MEDQIEINVEAKKLNEVLLSKRCSRHDMKKGKKAKRAKQKQQLRKQMKEDCGPLSCFPAL